MVYCKLCIHTLLVPVPIHTQDALHPGHSQVAQEIALASRSWNTMLDITLTQLLIPSVKVGVATGRIMALSLPRTVEMLHNCIHSVLDEEVLCVLHIILRLGGERKEWRDTTLCISDNTGKALTPFLLPLMFMHQGTGGYWRTESPEEHVSSSLSHLISPHIVLNPKQFLCEYIQFSTEINRQLKSKGPWPYTFYTQNAVIL